MITLSENAQKLLALLEKTGGMHEETCIKEMFPGPDWGPSREERIAHWKHDVNLYGQDQNRHVGNGEFMDFKATANYAGLVSAAYQELRKAGLATESNNGYNSYTFYPV